MRSRWSRQIIPTRALGGLLWRAVSRDSRRRQEQGGGGTAAQLDCCTTTESTSSSLLANAGSLEDFVARFPRRIINVHHSFLTGLMARSLYHRAERGVKLSARRANYVTEDLDEGPIIEQEVVRVSHRDGIDDLLQKGRDLEKVVLSRAVRWHIDHRILAYAHKTVVFD